VENVVYGASDFGELEGEEWATAGKMQTETAAMKMRVETPFEARSSDRAPSPV
jgi:hypothetical protein